jgi:ABC-type dipeptide/oligopeptide/nickel transport system ATPase component
MALLDIRNLTVAFEPGTTSAPSVPVVQDVSISLAQGEILGLIGERGSGKSVVGLSIARLFPSPPAVYPRGRVVLDGHDVLGLPARSLRQVRGRLVGYVFPDPGLSLTPILPVGTHLRQTLRLHQRDASSRKHAIQLLEEVGITQPEQCLRQYPHQLTAGMQQRVMFALAIASRPKLLVADEPTARLDATLQSQIIDLLRDLRARLGCAILILTRNPALVANLADHLAVLHAGQIVESGPAADLLRFPLHPYTRALLASVPTLEPGPHRPALDPP